MRVAIGAIEHETNTFSPIPTPLEAFHEARADLLEGEALLDAAQGTKTQLGAFVEVAQIEGWDLVPTIGAWATPSGNVHADAYSAMKARLLGHLRAADHLDAVLLSLHGAMLAENAPDAEGGLCAAVRELIGPDRPFVVTLDLHGNITPEMCAAVDAVFVYDTNPHVDAYERGLESAACLAAILNGSLPRPQVFISKPPMLPPTINMRTAEGPMRALLAAGREWEARPEIVNVAVFPGFPYADFAGAGLSVVVSATDPIVGAECATNMGRSAWQRRDEFLKRIPAIEEAVEQALWLVAQAGDGPIALADVADNPGGGGSGDTTLLLHELLRRGARGAVAAFWDPAAAQAAHAAGVGAEIHLRLGGNAAPELYGHPLDVRGKVTHLSDGNFVGWGPVYRGQSVACGPSACIDVNGLKFAVTSLRHAANDRGFFQVVGIQPEREPLLVIKSRGHFRADFEPICRAIIEVDAPGPANPNLERYAFQHIKRPLWPLDPETTWDGA